jgi:hypothetical protein
MISVVRHNCNVFINQNEHDSRTEMLMPLVLLLDYDSLEKEDIDSVLYKKSCDLYSYIISLPEENKYKRFSLFAAELKLKFTDNALKKYGLLSEDELKYMIDFIDTYGGFRV